MVAFDSDSPAPEQPTPIAAPTVGRPPEVPCPEPATLTPRLALEAAMAAVAGPMGERIAPGDHLSSHSVVAGPNPGQEPTVAVPLDRHHLHAPPADHAARRGRCQDARSALKPRVLMPVSSGNSQDSPPLVGSGPSRTNQTLTMVTIPPDVRG